ncbi:universal stress protein [Gallaecimonas mangrovi]|uniref:universal stress protein n=1 Tax=Gallaecimonas mangrovi TaxID=2291597 RepID=UPI000E20AB6C|nr:universal stress protein [Gallaecimonas mangrovi]
MSSEVVACIDGPQTADLVAEYGAWLSGRLSAPLTLLHILDVQHGLHGGDFSGALGLGAQEALIAEMAKLDEQRSKLAMEQGRLMLDALADKLVTKGLDKPQCRQRHGDVVQSFKELESDTRVWVLGKKGASDLSSAVLGVHVEGIIRALNQPVLLVSEAFKAPQSVMIAFDGSATTRKIVDVVAKSPIFKGLPCHLVMVGEETESHRSELAWAKAQLEAQQHDCHSQIMAGEVDKVLCQYQQQHNIDLLVMGAYGHSRIRQFLLGSTTTTLLQSTPVPVLLMR